MKNFRIRLYCSYFYFHLRFCWQFFFINLERYISYKVVKDLLDFNWKENYYGCRNTWILWKIVANLGFNLNSFIGRSILSSRRGGDGGRSLFWPATEFTLLKNMKIWCKIQVIKHPLLFNVLYIYALIDNSSNPKWKFLGY